MKFKLIKPRRTVTEQQIYVHMDDWKGDTSQLPLVLMEALTLSSHAQVRRLEICRRQMEMFQQSGGH